MTDQIPNDTTNVPRIVAIGTGVLTLSSAAYGFYLSLKSLVRAVGGGFTELLQQYEIPYFYPAFYSMLNVTIVCCLVLAWCGLDQVRLRVAHLKLFIWLFVYEVMYLFFIGGFLWPLPDTGMSIGAASGVANNGLMPPFYILLPLWAPFALAWAKKRLTNGTTGHLTEPLRTETEGYCGTRLVRVINSRVFTALIGGVGGGISSFLLLWNMRVFGALNEYLSDFTIQVIAFLLGGLCAICSAILDSPTAARRIPGWHYIAVVLFVFASYFAATVWHRGIILSFITFLPMALIVGIFLNGFSLRALKNCLWAFVGSVFGTIGLIIVERIFQYAGVGFLFGYGIDVGFEWYGFTLGLLLSQVPTQRKAERGIASRFGFS